MIPYHLSELFASAPVTFVRGVVAKTGVGGGQGRGDVLWQMTFYLDAWRIDDQKIEMSPLLVRRAVTQQELTDFSHRIKRDTIIQFRARVVFDDGPREEYTALLEEYIGIEEADAELASVAQELQSPITLNLPPFPPLCFLGNSCWSGVAFLQTWAGFQIVPELYGGATGVSDGNISLTVNGLERKIESLEDRRLPPTSDQIAAYRFYVEREEAICKKIMQAIFEDYLGLQKIYDIDESEREVMPDIERPEQLKTLIQLRSITISEKSKDGFAYMGFDFKCAWDPEHGFGVAIHKDRVLAVADGGCVWWVAASDLEGKLKPL